MTLFKTNYSDVQESASYGPIPTGEYEMIIKEVQEKQTPNGKEAVQLTLVVRNDLSKVPALAETNGKYANRHVFNDNWKRNIEGRYIYDVNQFMHYLKAVDVPENTEVKDMDHLFQLLTGKPVLVYVKEEDNTYNGETKQINTVAPWGYKPTAYENVNHTWKDGESGSTQESNPYTNYDGPLDISDEDMPF